MPFKKPSLKTLRESTFYALYLTAAILPLNALSSGNIFVGRMAGLNVEVQGERALFKNDMCGPDIGLLCRAMINKDIQQIAIEPDKMAFYKHQASEPVIVYFSPSIEPTPTTATGIPTIDQTKGLQLLSSKTLELTSTVLSHTAVLKTPSLPSTPHYDSNSFSSSVAFFEDEQQRTVATVSIPLTPASSTMSSDGSYIDLDFGDINTLRIYPSLQSSPSISGYFKQIIRSAADSQEAKNDSGQQRQHTSTTASQSTATSATVASAASSASLINPTMSTPMLQPEASASLEDEIIAQPSSLTFTRYRTISGVDSTLILEAFKRYLKEHPEKDLDWVVLEKIHGSNYSFVTNGEMVKAAKRVEFIPPEDKFFNHAPVYERYKERVLEMFREFCKEGDQLIVFGELYGGEKIQNNIYYKEEVDFAAFDIVVNGKKVDHDTFRQWTQTINIPTVAELGTFSSFEEALGFNPVFTSRHSEKSHNAEGIVIKPSTPLYLPNDTKKPIILNIKNPKYDETSFRVKPSKTDLSDNGKKLFQAILSELTEMRLLAVRSKYGEITTEKDRQKIKGLLIKDAAEDYNRKNNANIKKNDEWKKINRHLESEALKLISNLPEQKSSSQPSSSSTTPPEDAS